MAENLVVSSLLSLTNRVEAPFIRVKIAGYTFGVYRKDSSISGGYINVYPNYVQSLKVNKINGLVNQYSLEIVYPVTQGSDPNYFEKLFGMVSTTRTISISYGDATMPDNYIYKEDNAIITSVKTNVDIQGCTISYTIEAIGTSGLALGGSYNFSARTVKPSEEIYKILYDENNEYHLLDIFTGMKDRKLVEQNGLIAGSDYGSVYIPEQMGVSALDYIGLLVSFMTPMSSPRISDKKDSVYSLTTFDDAEGLYGGPYFKVSLIPNTSKVLNQLYTHTIDIGYPTANVVTAFDISTNDNWAIYYDYQKSLDSTNNVPRIDLKGKERKLYSPMLKDTKYLLDDSDKTWWTKVTEFPIEAKITILGLLKPAILMTYVKLNVWMLGRKHISSGYYIITSQEDNISSNGYFTTLGLTRVAGDEDFENI